MKTLTERIEEDGIEIARVKPAHTGEERQFWSILLKIEGYHEHDGEYFTRHILVEPFDTDLTSMPPKLVAVVNSLVTDASTYEDSAGVFIEWAKNYGPSLDDVNGIAAWDEVDQAMKTFENMKRTASDLRRFLGDKLYDAYLHETEFDV